MDRVRSWVFCQIPGVQSRGCLIHRCDRGLGLSPLPRRDSYRALAKANPALAGSGTPHLLEARNGIDDFACWRWSCHHG